MKSVILILMILVSGTTMASEDAVKNCYGNRSTEFFVSSLEGQAKKGVETVSLLNNKNEVVGYVAVEPQRSEDYPNVAKAVEVRSLYLCSSKLEVSTFFYPEENAEDLLKWVNAPKGSVYIFQDEGRLDLEVTAVEDSESSYAKKVTVNFKGYDVFREEDEIESQRGQEDFLEDWGIPRAKGTFSFYIPRNWIIAK